MTHCTVCGVPRSENDLEDVGETDVAADPEDSSKGTVDATIQWHECWSCEIHYLTDQDLAANRLAIAASRAEWEKTRPQEDEDSWEQSNEVYEVVLSQEEHNEREEDAK